eukprot:scaffold679_cov374-Prasinococcus_capsulatus_cf.AAC.17
MVWQSRRSPPQACKRCRRTQLDSPRGVALLAPAPLLRLHGMKLAPEGQHPLAWQPFVISA